MERASTVTSSPAASTRSVPPSSAGAVSRATVQAAAWSGPGRVNSMSSSEALMRMRKESSTIR